ncbi:MAG TPA: glycine cleavage system protein GcvH [Caulobacterales bacterium]|nr:glycine cleavage system protein GcvH [Caulobacterales bacterium]
MKYTKEHEWVRVEGDVATCGISAYAAEKLGDVVYVELPPEGVVVEKDKEMAVVESAKAASDVYAPLSGVIAAQNEDLDEKPEIVSESPEGEGWFVKIKLSNPAELDGLMNETQYADYVKGL